MATQRWKTVRDLRNAPLSNALHEILEGMVPSRHRFASPTADISSYVEQVLRMGQNTEFGTNAFVFGMLAQMVGSAALRSVIRSEASRTDLALSPGLATVFADAFEIRQETGGKDEFIGTRHVLVSILTSADRDVGSELAMAMEPLGRLDTAAMMTSLADLLAGALEKNENPEAWRSILLRRGFGEAASRMPERGSVEPAPLKRSRPAADDIVARRQPTRKAAPTLASSGGASPPGGPPSPPFDTLPSEPPPGPPSDPPPEPPEDPAAIGVPQIDPIASVRNDDPRALTAADIVGVDGSATALARVIAAKAFQPPLAVGVFGPWGSGKSFFLRRVETEIDRLRDAGDGAFLSQIVKVRFNAWHYVDTSLWANLVGEIFETLDRRSSPSEASKDGVLNRLTTARALTIASARDLAAKRQAALAAKTRLHDAEIELREKRAAVSTKIKGLGLGLKAGWNGVAKDPGAKALVEATYGQPLEDMAVQWTKPEAALRALRDDGAVWLKIRRELGSPGKILVCLAVAGALASIPFWLSLLPDPREGLKAVIERLNPLALAVSGLLATASAWSAAITRKAVTARDAVVAAVAAYRASVDKAGAEETSTLADAQSAFEAAGVKVEASRLALDEAIAIQASATVALTRDTPAERLRAFVKAKAGVDGPYRSQQGLIGTIRRDFADLSDLMSADDTNGDRARKVSDQAFASDIQQLRTDFPDILSEEEFKTIQGPAEEPKPGERFDRIVLYIDDLDRCPPDKVLDVLQAVHLLMAFSLFVVIVAVDVRWLEAALKDRHAQFGGKDDDPKALEYLEKIFQLAIWTQPLQTSDLASFIQRRLAAPEPVAATAATAAEPVTPDLDAPPVGQGAPPSPDRTVEERVVEEAVAVPITSAAPVSASETLRMTPQEIAFLERICGVLDMTPRRVLRLLNSYQVARAGLEPVAAGALMTGGHRGFISLLALSVAWPEELCEIAAALEGAESWDAFDAAMNSQDEEGLSLARIEDWRRVTADEGLTVPALRAYLPLTLRFSFVGPVAAANHAARLASTIAAPSPA